LKNGRAAGADGITAELLKGAEKPISEALHKVIINVWSAGRVTAEWKEGIIVSLCKGKGSQSECSSYRPISLMSVSGKVWFYCRVVYYVCNISLEIVGRVTPKF